MSNDACKLYLERIVKRLSPDSIRVYDVLEEAYNYSNSNERKPASYKIKIHFNVPRFSYRHFKAKVTQLFNRDKDKTGSFSALNVDGDIWTFYTFPDGVSVNDAKEITSKSFDLDGGNVKDQLDPARNIFLTGKPPKANLRHLIRPSVAFFDTADLGTDYLISLGEDGFRDQDEIPKHKNSEYVHNTLENMRVRGEEIKIRKGTLIDYYKNEEKIWMATIPVEEFGDVAYFYYNKAFWFGGDVEDSTVLLVNSAPQKGYLNAYDLDPVKKAKFNIGILKAKVETGPNMFMVIRDVNKRMEIYEESKNIIKSIEENFGI